MKAGLKPVLRLLLFGNLWIALGAALITAQTCWLIERPGAAMAWFVFFSTASGYTFHRLMRFNRWSLRLQSTRVNWLLRSRKVLTVWFAFTSVMASVWAVSIFPFEFLVALLPLVLITAAYVVPVIPARGEWLALRDVPGAKLWVIAFTWATVTVALPLWYFKPEIGVAAMFLMIIERSCWIAALTIPFDVRDVSFDDARQKTLPQTRGVGGALRVSFGLMGAFAVMVSLLFLLNEYSFFTWLAILASAAVGIVMIYKSKSVTNEFYHAFWIDGLIILQPALVFLSLG